MSTDLILQPPQIGPTVVLSGALIAEVSSLEQHLGALPAVTDQGSLDAVRAVMVAASRLAGQVDAQRANAKRPWAEVGKAIDAAAKPVITRLELVKGEAKQQIEAFLREQDRIKQEAARAQAIAQAAATAALQQGNAPQLQVTVLPAEIKAPTQRRPTVRINDFQLIPREYFDLNTERVREALLSGKVVPGAELIEEYHVVAR